MILCCDSIVTELQALLATLDMKKKKIHLAFFFLSVVVVRTKQQQNTTYRSTKLKFAFIKKHIVGLV